METGPQKLLFDAVRILNKLKVKYFITGGFAVSVWGRIRYKIDIDIVIELIEPKIGSLIKELRITCKDGYVNEDIAKEAEIRLPKGEVTYTIIDGKPVATRITYTSGETWNMEPPKPREDWGGAAV